MIAKVAIFIALFGITLASLPMIHGPVHHHAAQPYKFGYDIKDHHGEQYRQEEGNGGQAVKGSYGFTDARGVKRQVNYVADHAGFRAQVRTNEPGTANQNPAAVHMVSDAPYAGGVAAVGGLGGYGLGNAGLGYGYGGYGLGNAGLGYGYGGYGLGNAGLGYGYGGYGLGSAGLGYGYGGYGLAGGLNGRGLGYGGQGYAGSGLGLGILGGLGYARYGY